MGTFGRFVFYFLVLKPLALLVLGLNVRRRHLLPATGPAVLAANHNSHLDTAVLLSLFPFRVARDIRPVAAADYFLRNPWLAWFSRHIMRIIPVDRTSASARANLMEGVAGALARKQIVLFFPEGTRGEPEQLAEFRTGIAQVANRHPDVPIIPVFLHGLGKALPRGEGLLVPFCCDVFVGEPIYGCGDRADFMQNLQNRFRELAAEGHFPSWV